MMAVQLGASVGGDRGWVTVHGGSRGKSSLLRCQKVAERGLQRRSLTKRCLGFEPGPAFRLFGFSLGTRFGVITLSLSFECHEPD